MVPQGCPSRPVPRRSHSCSCLPAWSPWEISPPSHFPQPTCPYPSNKNCNHPQCCTFPMGWFLGKSLNKLQGGPLIDGETAAQKGAVLAWGNPWWEVAAQTPQLTYLATGTLLPSFPACQWQPLPCKREPEQPLGASAATGSVESGLTASIWFSFPCSSQLSLLFFSFSLYIFSSPFLLSSSSSKYKSNTCFLKKARNSEMQECACDRSSQLDRDTYSVSLPDKENPSAHHRELKKRGQ